MKSFYDFSSTEDSVFPKAFYDFIVYKLLFSTCLLASLFFQAIWQIEQVERLADIGVLALIKCLN